MKKIALLIPLCLFLLNALIFFQPSALAADSYDAATTAIIIDTAPTASIEASVEAALLAEGSGHTKDNITHLTITSAVTYALTADDLTYLQEMGALTHLDVATSVGIEGGSIGNDFFRENSTLISIDFPGTSFSESCFYRCPVLESISLPEALSLGNLSISYCGKLSYANLPKASTLADYAFSGCTSLETISLPLTSSFGWNCFRGCSKLTSVSLPEAETFGRFAFKGCTRLTSIVLPKATTFDNGCFEDCMQLASISLPEGATFGSDAFGDCRKLTSVNLPKAETFGEYCFSGCSELSSISLPEALTFDDAAFMDCIKLTSVDLPKATTFGVACFIRCAELALISLPEAVTFGMNAFAQCDKLASISLPKAESFGDCAFWKCPLIETINLPLAQSFGNGAFQYCTSLETVSLPETQTMGTWAFYECSSLGSITLPKLTALKSNCFNNCTNLTSVSLPLASSFGQNVFEGCTKTINLYLNETIPAASPPSFGTYPFPAGSKLTIPETAYINYDNDPNDTSSEEYDGLWFGWPLDNHYGIKYDLNDGNGAVPAAGLYTGGIPVALSAGSGIEKSGYSLTGWNTSKEGDGTHFALGANITVSQNLKLYAEWALQATPEPTAAPTAAPTATKKPGSGSSYSRTPSPSPTAAPTATPDAEQTDAAVAPPTPAISATPDNPAPTPALIAAEVVPKEGGKSQVTIDISTLPEGTKSVKLPSGETVPVSAAEDGKLIFELDSAFVGTDGTVEIIAIDDEAIALGSYVLEMPAQALLPPGEKAGGFPFWVWILIAVVAAVWVTVFISRRKAPASGSIYKKR